LNVENDLCWGKIRETQRQAARKLRNVFVVPATDCILTDVIHNNSSSNIKLGERIARLALSEIYGKKINAKAPDLAAAKKTGSNKAELVFDNVYGSFNFMGLAASDLTITASDEIGILNVKEFSSEKNRIALEFTRDMQGKVFFHNAYTCNPSYFVPRDTATGLPMLSFYHIEAE